MALQDILIAAGAPVLKSIIADKLGGIGGRLANAAIDALAEAFSTPTKRVEPTPEAIEREFQADQTRGTEIIKRVEVEASDTAARIAEASRDQMVSYHGVLEADLKQEGWVARNWRPMFAVVFTVCYATVIFTMCWLAWTRQLGTLSQLADVTTFLTFAFIAGCAVLGVQVWQRGQADKASP